MPKGASKDVNRRYQQEGDQINQESNRFGNMLYDRTAGAQGRADNAYNSAYGGYNNFLSGAGRAGSPGGGGYNFGNYENDFRNAGNVGSSISDENRARIRGKGVFDEFAKTGGYSDVDQANIRSRANSTIPSMFDAIRDRMGQQATIQGGGGPAYTSSLQRIARDQSRGAADTALDTELGIKEKVNEGRRWGSGSLSDAEKSLTGMQLQDTDLMNKYKMQGLENAFRAAATGAGMNQQSNSDYDRNSLAALEGLHGLRTDQPGEEFGLYDRLLGNMGQRGQLQGGNQGGYSAYNPNKSFLDQVMPFLGMGANFAMPFLTGGGKGGATRGGSSSVGSYGGSNPFGNWARNGRP